MEPRLSIQPYIMALTVHLDQYNYYSTNYSVNVSTLKYQPLSAT